MVIPETRRAHLIKYLRFYYYYWRWWQMSLFQLVDY